MKHPAFPCSTHIGKLRTYLAVKYSHSNRACLLSKLVASLALIHECGILQGTSSNGLPTLLLDTSSVWNAFFTVGTVPNATLKKHFFIIFRSHRVSFQVCFRLLLLSFVLSMSCARDRYFPRFPFTRSGG